MWVFYQGDIDNENRKILFLAVVLGWIDFLVLIPNILGICLSKTWRRMEPISCDGDFLFIRRAAGCLLREKAAKESGKNPITVAGRVLVPGTF